MALSLSKSKLFALSLSITRRGYAAAVEGSAAGGFGKGGSMRSMMGKVEERRLINGSGSEASNAWAPDPLTGYYRPANHVEEIDPVELRQMLLNNKVRPL